MKGKWSWEKIQGGKHDCFSLVEIRGDLFCAAPISSVSWRSLCVVAISIVPWQSVLRHGDLLCAVTISSVPWRSPLQRVSEVVGGNPREYPLQVSSITQWSLQPIEGQGVGGWHSAECLCWFSPSWAGTRVACRARHLWRYLASQGWDGKGKSSIRSSSCVMRSVSGCSGCKEVISTSLWSRWELDLPSYPDNDRTGAKVSKPFSDSQWVEAVLIQN